MTLISVMIATISSKMRLRIERRLMIEMIWASKVAIHSWLQILGLEYLYRFVSLKSYLRWYKHRRVLWSLELQYDMAWSSEAFNLHLDYVSNIEKCSKLLDTTFFQYNSRSTNIKRTVNAKFLEVFDKGLNDISLLKLCKIWYVSVDESIFCAQPCFSHDLREYSHLFIVLLSVLIELMYKLQRSIFFVQLLIDHR